MDHDHASRFVEAFHTFTPEPTDSLDAIPFYRTWAGLRAVWGQEFIDQYNSAVHHAMCDAVTWHHYDDPTLTYQAACKAIQYLADRPSVPQEPYYRHSYATEPQPPSEQDAYEFFKSSFREAFPGKRINSKFAKEKWNEKKQRALEIVTERYQNTKAEYDTAESERHAENTARQREYQAELDRIATFQRAVAELIR